MAVVAVQYYNGGGDARYDDSTSDTKEYALPKELVSDHAGLTLTSGSVFYTYFTAERSVTVDGAAMITGGTAAATPTTCKIGLYSVDPTTGDLTRVAVTANTTTLWDGTDARDTVDFTAAYDLKAGYRYAAAALFVGTTAPVVLGRVGAAAVDVPLGLMDADGVRRSGVNASETDLTASVLAAAVADSIGCPYIELIHA